MPSYYLTAPRSAQLAGKPIISLGATIDLMQHIQEPISLLHVTGGAQKRRHKERKQ
jgi:hypothetical protein